jgi:hypothetical protein
MPEIPDVDIQSLGQAEEEQEDIEQDTERDDQVANRCGKRQRRCSRPAYVDDIEVRAGILRKVLADRADGATQQTDRQKDTDEGHSRHQAAADRAVPFLS